eukprot:98295_1
MEPDDVYIDSMGTWTIYIYEMITGVAIYTLIYSLTIIQAHKHTLSPKHCLSFAMNIGGILNGILAVIASIYFVIDKRWNEIIIGYPRTTGHIYCYITAFFIVDTVFPIVFYLKYPQKTVPRRYDMIVHHILSMLPLFLVEIPDPIYAWNILSLIPLTEITSVMLCAQWIARHFEHTKCKERFKLSFVVTWFTVRVPLYILMVWWVIRNWEAIWRQCPLHVAVSMMVIGFGLSLLQIPWSVLIALKFMKRKPSNDQTETKNQTAHGVSLSFIDRRKQTGRVVEDPTNHDIPVA